MVVLVSELPLLSLLPSHIQSGDYHKVGPHLPLVSAQTVHQVC